MTTQEQKIEAIKRMKLLKLHENPIREFEEEGRLNRLRARFQQRSEFEQATRSV